MIYHRINVLVKNLSERAVHRNRLTFFVFVALCVSIRAHADLKSWSVIPELTSVGDFEDKYLLNLRPTIGFKWQSEVSFFKDISVSVEARLRADTQSEFVSTGKSYEFKGDHAYLQWQGNRASVGLGLQKYTWGDSAFFDGVDFLNPRDLTEPLYSDDEQTKIAVPSVNLQYLGDNTVFQTVVTLKASRSPFERSFNGISVEKPADRRWIADSEFGLKAGGLLKNGWDINGYLLSYFERVPQFYLSGSPQTGFAFKVNEPRVFSMGLSATQSAGDFVFRSEFALHSNRALPDQGAMLRSRSDQAVFHATLDATAFSDLLTTFEFWREHWFSKKSTNFLPDSMLGGLRTQKSFWNGRFEPAAGVLLSPDRKERWSYVRAQLKPYDSLQLSAELHWAQTSTGRVLARRGLRNLIRSSISFQF
ncbi:MAG: hypothetical protein RLZZ488_818 [Pseudomonadota bacterium]